MLYANDSDLKIFRFGVFSGVGKKNEVHFDRERRFSRLHAKYEQYSLNNSPCKYKGFCKIVPLCRNIATTMDKIFGKDLKISKFFQKSSSSSPFLFPFYHRLVFPPP